MFNYHFIKSQLQSSKKKKKYLIIESDDWGSERIPSLAAQRKLKSFGIGTENNPYTKFDTLERLGDLEALQHLLNNFQKKYNKLIKITANFIIENPQFEKIETEQFSQYFGQSFLENYFNRDGNLGVWDKILELKKTGYFTPQFHGREHVHVLKWMDELKKNNELFRKAFDLGCYGIDNQLNGVKKNLLASFEYSNEKEKVFITNSFIDGYEKFEQLFGYKSESLVIPRHVWNPDLNSVFANNGVKFIQTSLNQLVPDGLFYRKIRHYTGEIDTYSNIKFLVRNVFFEPSYNNKEIIVEKTFRRIKMLMSFNIPVIISMHRLNFMGGIIEQNRDINLKLFRDLLDKIISEYPEIEFLSSNEMGNKL